MWTMTWIRWRRGASAYLALFFMAVAAAPHHHLNSLEDLLLDQRSDSGTIVVAEGTPAVGVSALHAAHVVSDVPCPACFLGDFVCGPAASFLFVAKLAPLTLPSDRPEPATPALIPAETSSRSPPIVS